MANKKGDNKSEGPFLLLNLGNVIGKEIASDGFTLTTTAFKTRAGLEKYIENNKTSTAEFIVFDAVSRVGYEHVVKYSPVSGNAK